MITDWIIAIGGSDVDGNILYKFTGTAKEAKKKLMDIVLRDREDNAEDFDHGTSDMENIIQVDDCENEFYAYNCFFSYHTDYTIKEISKISDIRKEQRYEEEEQLPRGYKPLYTMQPLGWIKENGKDYEHFMIIQWSSTKEDSHEIGHKAYYLSSDFCCIRTSNDDASWVSDDYIDYKPSVDWNSDDWKEQLEQDMFKALSMYAKKRCYSFNKPNSLKLVSINSPKSVFITGNE